MSKMSKTVYTVHAYRWGDRECHSYGVGVYSKKHAALKAADIEEDYRGGKYMCEVLEWTLDTGIAGNHDDAANAIKPLPPRNNTGSHRPSEPEASEGSVGGADVVRVLRKSIDKAAKAEKARTA